MGMPNCAKILKYEIKDAAKLTFPIPAGCKILVAYGNVISEKANDDMVNTIF